MARARRPYLPGAFFHLIARTQNKAHWFEDDVVKDSIVSFLADAVDACDADLVAFCIMHNHLHVIVRQRRAPLAAFMQPVLRRCALLTQRSFGIDGHTFSRKFRHRVCRDAEELRYCIGYVHRNPLKAGACADPAEYRWCSHADYLSDSVPPEPLRRRAQLLTPLELYSRAEGRSIGDLRIDYLTYLAEMESASTNGLVRQPAPIHGDTYWTELSKAQTLQESTAGRGVRMDLRDVVLIGIRQLCPELDIAMIRLFRGSRMIRIRAELVERAGQAGHRGCDIARYLHMSESRVSEILKRQRIRAKRGGALA